MGFIQGQKKVGTVALERGAAGAVVEETGQKGTRRAIFFIPCVTVQHNFPSAAIVAVHRSTRELINFFVYERYITGIRRIGLAQIIARGGFVVKRTRVNGPSKRLAVHWLA